MRTCAQAQRPTIYGRYLYPYARLNKIKPGILFAIERRRCYSRTAIVQNEQAPRVAIIGSGPAGFYTARKLMREVEGTKIDMYERLPVPFGLVRFGVAPDHPEVKNCQDEFEQVASSPSFNFIGNIQLGQDLPLSFLAKNYDAIVFSYGASQDRQLGLEGEDKPHIYSARAFVGWYNGLPEYRDFNPDLFSGEIAIVVGQGNVALDVARVLLSSVEELEKTDLTSYAIEYLKNSRIKKVHVVGRRGPMQAAFTIKEIRELIQLPGVNFDPIDPSRFPNDLKALPRPKKRLMELLVKGKPHDPTATKSWSLDFQLSPSKLNWSDEDPNTLTGVTFTKTHLPNPADPYSPANPTTETATIPTSTLFRSIGYRAEPIPGMETIGVPFDNRSGTIRHDGLGRVIPLDAPEHKASVSASAIDHPLQPIAAAEASASLYCAGWVKRGPTGVIASTMTDAFQTAEVIVQDWRNKLAQNKDTVTGAADEENDKKRGWPAVKAAAEAEGYNLDKVVNWDGWHRIDQAEKELGLERGKPREKFGRVAEMEEVAAGVRLG